MLLFSKKTKKTENIMIFGCSGSGKSFSGIASSIYKKHTIKSEILGEDFEDILKNCNNFYGYFITDSYIEETAFLLKINKELFQILLLILKKHNYNPIGRNLYFKNSIFFMDGLEIHLKKYNDKYYLNQILDDFKEDFDYMFSEDLDSFSDIEKAEYILDNYKDYYDEDLYFFEDYCYNIYDKNFKKDISLPLFENDIEFFIKELKIDNFEAFFKDMSRLFIKGVVLYSLNNKNEKIYRNILCIDNIYNLDIKNNIYLERLFEMPKEYILMTKIDVEDALKDNINQFF